MTRATVISGVGRKSGSRKLWCSPHGYSPDELQAILLSGKLPPDTTDITPPPAWASGTLMDAYRAAMRNLPDRMLTFISPDDLSEMRRPNRKRWLDYLERSYGTILTDLNRASRHVLSDDFLHLANTRSYSEPGMMAREWAGIVPPDRPVWIEWAGLARTNSTMRLFPGAKSAAKIPLSGWETAQREGMLISRGAGNAEWYLTTVWFSGGRIVVAPVGFRWKPGSGLMTSLVQGTLREELFIIGGVDSKVEGDEQRRRQVSAMLGVHYLQKWPNPDLALCDDANLCLVPVFAGLFLQLGAIVRSPTEDMIGDFSGEIQGDYRLAMAVMALMQQQRERVLARPVDPDRKAKDAARVRNLPIPLEHKVLVIDADAAVRVPAEYQPPEEPSGRHHRWHEVQPHFCVSRKKFPLRPGCTHVWVAAGRKTQQCTNCLGKRWHRAAHARGDEKLGRIDKTYLHAATKH